MKLWIESLLGGSIVKRNIIRIVGGAATGQLIVLLTSPLISRLYDPSDFGSLATYTSLLNILLVAVNLRYDFAIVRPAKDEEALRLLGLALVCAIGFSFILVLIIPFVLPAFSKLMPEIVVWLLPLGLLLTGSYQALNYWAIRKSEGAIIGQTRLMQSATMVSVQLLGGIGGGSALGLAVGYIFGQTTGVGRLFRLIPMSLSMIIRQPRMISIALSYRQFPLLSLPAGLANVAALQLPTLFIAHTYGVGVAGWLALAQRVLGGPLDLIGSGVSQALMGEIAFRQNDAEGLRSLFNAAARRLSLLCVPVLLIGAACPFLFSFFFGPDWHESGIIAGLLSIMYTGRLLGGTLSQILVVLDKLSWVFFLDLTRLALVMIIFAVLNRSSYLTLIGCYSVAMGISYILYFFAARMALLSHNSNKVTL